MWVLKTVYGKNSIFKKESEISKWAWVLSFSLFFFRVVFLTKLFLQVTCTTVLAGPHSQLGWALLRNSWGWDRLCLLHNFSKIKLINKKSAMNGIKFYREKVRNFWETHKQYQVWGSWYASRFHWENTSWIIICKI